MDAETSPIREGQLRPGRSLDRCRSGQPRLFRGWSPPPKTKATNQLHFRRSSLVAFVTAEATLAGYVKRAVSAPEHRSSHDAVNASIPAEEVVS